MKITESAAKKFLSEEVQKSKLHFVEKNFLIIHSEAVLKCAKEIASLKNKKIDLKIIETAAWLHDVGQVISKEGHAEISLELSEKRFGKLPTKLIDCIANHGSNKNPKTKEGKIIQLADKLSIFQNTKGIAFLFSKKKYHEMSSKFLEKVSFDLIRVLKNFKW